MNKTSWLVFNFFVFLFLLLLCAAIQSSFLHWVFGWRPTIQGVVVILVYISLYRKPQEALAFIVLACFCTGMLSVMMTSLNIFAAVAIFLLIQALKARVYSPGPVYFTWTVLGGVLGFHLIAWLTSVIFEPRTPAPRPLDWILEVLITALFTRLFFHVLTVIDRKTRRSAYSELNP